MNDLYRQDTETMLTDACFCRRCRCGEWCCRRSFGRRFATRSSSFRVRWTLRYKTSPSASKLSKETDRSSGNRILASEGLSNIQILFSLISFLFFFLGSIDMELEFEDRKLKLTVNPVHAAIIWHFQSKRTKCYRYVTF